MIILVLFNSLTIQIISVREENVSFDRYKHLEDLYSNSIICPCSNVFISYSKLVSFSPRFHQVCSSGFISNGWIQVMMFTMESNWLPIDSQHFRLLAQLCELSRNTIDDAIRRLSSRSFVNLNLLTEPNFNAQINATIKQFTQTLLINFNLFIDTVRLLKQIDQPFSASSGLANIRASLPTNASINPQIPQVNCYFFEPHPQLYSLSHLVIISFHRFKRYLYISD